ncbi:putative U6 snRna-associated Sm family protein LSm8 [Cardiosporidium cionae]|uniref:U6 snRna-associated Sm family protein LSm8 n=1 Tax=Cardiosporidium cionae TaxID=476202 RepID=A0ABQ7J4Z9_9APIC|nr:putative U6 snRna-associated Sm family protein LSm8 [Cardiosporidium cionae]|eukprot:KAF8819033.1 putative U6 snRna-associated Sm family protein LSm8 [Cardiosporidium cionae]
MDSLETNLKLPNWLKSLEDELDCLLLVLLRDGRRLTGFLRTFDQYGNLMLEDVKQQITFESYFAELPLGCLIIRGDNIVLFGAVDDTKETALIRKPISEVLELQHRREVEQNAIKKQHLPSMKYHGSRIDPALDIWEE